MHYFPLTIAFLLFLLLLFIFLIVAIEVGVLSYAYQRMGIDRRYVFSLLILSLLGSYINIPLFQLPPSRSYRTLTSISSGYGISFPWQENGRKQLLP